MPLVPRGKGLVLVHVCNSIGKWGAGFVLAISRRWPQPKKQYQEWAAGAEGYGPFQLGAVQFVKVEAVQRAPGVMDWLWVANLIGQEDVGFHNGRPPIRYPAIHAGLLTVAEHAKKHGASVHMPRIGCSLAGGRWSEIEPIIRETLGLCDVNVYDLRRDDYNI